MASDSVHVHMYVPDVDGSYTRAAESGGTSVQASSQSGDGDRRSGVKSPGDITWWISTRVG